MKIYNENWMSVYVANVYNRKCNMSVYVAKIFNENIQRKYMSVFDKLLFVENLQ